MSLADRISKPEEESKTSWADEVNSPTVEKPEDAEPKPTESQSNGKPDMGQVDGSSEPFGGSQLQEPEYAVEVKLADMQADPNNPLYSAQSFEQLNL
jgi:ATP-dependent RNA helicase DDX19/DBP5